MKKTISILNKRKVQNAIKEFNSFSKKNVEIIEVKGDWNGYTYPIEDKLISISDLNRMLKSKKLNQNSKQKLQKIYTNPEQVIREKAEKHINKYYPSAPTDLLNSLEFNYCNTGRSGVARKFSNEFLNRLDNLIISHIRHNYTNYDNTSCENDMRQTMRMSYNNEARKILAEWREE